MYVPICLIFVAPNRTNNLSTPYQHGQSHCPYFSFVKRFWLIEVVMGTISKTTFSRDIAELVEKTANLDLKYQWQFNDYRNGQFLSNSSVLELNGQTILRTFHITYSESYEVPILWFIFSRQTGALLNIEEILELMPADKQKTILSNCLTSISQREHPVFNLLFYHFHPCRTANLMKEVRYDNYVISWLSIFGSLLHLLPLPNEIFIKK
ncbi:unnamed protein product [Brugia pahangi]|uniref:Ubiquitin-like-conjugating enzyme ATG10 n=1 Tax=Brugia pahangi TaxID=6280 RepID=A0A0N4T3D0_BRUPA|nr:unnamed protein product [Brugia pahangi]